MTDPKDIVATPITIIHLVALRSAVRLEKLGMRRSRNPQARTIAAKEMKLPAGSSYDIVIERLSTKIDELRQELEDPDDC